jgi:hypothetical protein
MSVIDTLKKKMDIRCANVMSLSPNMGNVYKNYHWSVNNPNQEHINDVPIVILTEFQSNTGPALENMAYTARTVKALAQQALATPNPNPYLHIYNGVKTYNIFQLPFLASYNHTISNTWDSPDESKGKDAQTKGREGIAKMIGFFQRGVIEERKVWKGTGGGARYAFTFTLYNTYDPYVDIPKNLNFIRTLVHNNLPDRTSFGTMLPPCFYTLEIPGVRYAPMVVLEGINVNNIGQINRRVIPIMNDSGSYEDSEVNIPDAWEITISVCELLSESRDIYNATFDSSYRSKVSVISEEALSKNGVDNISLKTRAIGKLKGLR